VLGDEILAEAVGLISEHTVMRTNHEGNECDLIVAVDPDDITLKQAYSYLQPAGSIYIEWILSPISNIRFIKRKLEAIGFRNVAFYMPKPDPSDFPPAVIWVPLVQNVVVDYLTGNSRKYKKETASKRLLILFRRIIILLFPKLLTSYPWLASSGKKKFKICSIATKPIGNIFTAINTSNTSATGSELIESIPDIIEECLKNIGLHDKSLKTNILMLSERGGFEKVIMFVFTELDNKPSFILKLPKSDEAKLSLKTEEDVLYKLHQKFKVNEGIPKIIFDSNKSGLAPIVETFIDGVPLSNILTNDNYKSLSMEVTVWLSELAQYTKTLSNEDLKIDYKTNIVSTFIKFYESVLTPMQIEKIYDILGKLELGYRVCVHNDLGHWNILVKSNGSLGVIDWEISDLAGYPFTDLIMILMWMSFHREKERIDQYYLEFYREMLDSSTYTAKVTNECLEYYAYRLNIPLIHIPAFRLLTLLIQADIEYPHLISSMQESNKDTMCLEKSFYIKLIKEELLHSGEN